MPSTLAGAESTGSTPPLAGAARLYAAATWRGAREALVRSTFMVGPSRLAERA
jgi:hypothetical protein